ncbi:MAG TPA: L,D-transpeptidase, partial [Desulfobacterales bacterium]|nr:L,D-transpeptidase [Desulfobacterales bacterium]
MNLRKQTVFFIICICILFFGFLSYAQNVSNDEHSSLEVDVLKKIASHTIKKAFENSKNLDEAAVVIGVDSRELQLLCLALDITIPFAEPEVEPVPVVSSGQLTDNNLEPEVIIDYQGTSPYVIIVEKSSHTLFLLKYEKGIKTVVNTFNCKTGKIQGDKKITGDEKTPEGIYFPIQKYSRKHILQLVGKQNAFQY